MAGTSNLRIIYKNLLNSYNTLSATNINGLYPIANTLTDVRGVVARTTTTSTTISITWASNQNISSVIIPYSNLTSTCTLRIRLYSDELMSTQIYDSGTLSSGIFLANTSLFTNTLGSNYRYSFGGSSCIRKYFTQYNTCRGIKIDLVDTSNTDGYLEIGKIVVGSYWSPTYNTEFGLSIGIADSSTKLRTQNGSLITDIGTSNKFMNFNLSYMNSTDRDTLFNIINSIGTKASMHISLFPEDADSNKEYIHQIYGRLSDLATITHPMYSIYASTINIEEV